MEGTQMKEIILEEILLREISLEEIILKEIILEETFRRETALEERGCSVFRADQPSILGTPALRRRDILLQPQTTSELDFHLEKTMSEENQQIKRQY